MGHDRFTQQGCNSRPLCCSYEGVRFDALPLETLYAADRANLVARWAIGMHASGEQEILGAWLESGSAGRFLGDRLRELMDRGVESVGAIFDGDTSVVGHPSSGSARRVARAQPSLTATCEKVANSIRRAALRRGPFDGPETAARFLGEFAQRTEKNLRSGRDSQSARSASSEPIAVGHVQR